MLAAPTVAHASQIAYVGEFDLTDSLQTTSAGGAVYDAQTGNLWLGAGSGSEVFELDTQTGTVLSTFPGLSLARALAQDPITGNLFLFRPGLNQGFREMTTTGAFVNQVTGGPGKIVATFDDAGNLFTIPAVPQGSSSFFLEQIDKSTGSVLSSVPIRGLPINLSDLSQFRTMTYDSDAGTLLLLEDGGRILYEIDPVTGTPLGYQQVPGFVGLGVTVAIAHSPTTNEMAFFSDYIGESTLLMLGERVTDSKTQYCFGDGIVGVCPCGNDGGEFRGCAGTSQIGALLDGNGQASISNDSLILQVRSAAPSVSGLFFSGTQRTAQLTFGDGLRCVGGTLKRLEVAPTNSSGDAETQSPLSTVGGVTAGSTLYYQYWYRDVNGPCGSGFNASGALSVYWKI